MLLISECSLNPSPKLKPSILIPKPESQTLNIAGHPDDAGVDAGEAMKREQVHSGHLDYMSPGLKFEI